MPCTSTKTVSACLPVRLHEDKLDLAKKAQAVNIGFESLGHKTRVRDSHCRRIPPVSVTHSALTTKIGATGNFSREWDLPCLERQYFSGGGSGIRKSEVKFLTPGITFSSTGRRSRARRP